MKVVWDGSVLGMKVVLDKIIWDEKRQFHPNLDESVNNLFGRLLLTQQSFVINFWEEAKSSEDNTFFEKIMQGINLRTRTAFEGRYEGLVGGVRRGSLPRGP